jgi:hypothetical protein
MRSTCRGRANVAFQAWKIRILDDLDLSGDH